MMMKNKVMFGAVVIALFIVSAFAQTADEDCNGAGLIMTCLGPIKDVNSKPTPECCAKVKEQSQTCLCEYLTSNAAVQKLFNNEEAQRLLTACQVPKPACPAK